ncbi:uncharacterized protein LOC111011466 [Momordica charantia]|uniref:Uncharacterized protein LOC111011466 n=1 Tax=Momordica charantia TaxID=3673 RepID=A0A6J1CH43_MOMCH|nr:uncharacterized protein LOC111011466 [Momordica charantia]
MSGSKVKGREREMINGRMQVGEHHSPLRSILCVKNVVDLKRFDEREDCYVLDFDPFHSPDPSISKDTDSELSIVGEKGQVACRDYPHARYLCVKFPFDTTPHQSCCTMCFCYVCDSRAPCDHWSFHCSASHTNPLWEYSRHYYNNNINMPSTLH